MKHLEQKKIISAVMIFAVTLFASAQEALMATGTVADWETGKSDTLSADSKEKAVVCAGKGNIEIISKNAMKIDTLKAYAFSGMFKTGTGSAPVKCYFGLSPLNDKGEQIKTNQINFVKGTETELAAECSPDSTVLKIKNGANWKPDQHYCIAFETDDSGTYSDLPNSKLSSSGILKVEKKDADYEVTMKTACRVKYPAGTKIRVQSAGPSAIYGGAAGKALASEWTEIKGLVKSSEAIDSMNLIMNWWPGVKKVKFFVAFYPESPDSSITISFKDLKLEEAK